MKYNDYLSYLESLRDDKYKEFNERIITSKYEILGIKFPILRKIARNLNTNYQFYLENCQNKYFEEVFIYGLLSLNDSNYFFKYLDKIDNWALCDSFVISQKYILKNKDKYFNKYVDLLSSNKVYYIRVGIVTLLYFYQDKIYRDTIMEALKKITCEDYYVLMAIAWLLQVMVLDSDEEVIAYLKERKNNKLTRMTMGKIRDSYKISLAKKKELIKQLNCVII